MWSIHDLLAYGLLPSQVNKGYKGCHACGPNTCVVIIPKGLGKLFMDVTTSGCNLLIHGDQIHMTSMGKSKRKATPLVMKGFEVLDHANAYEMWKLNGGREDDNPCVNIGMKCKNILFDLPYWKALGLEPH